MYAPSHPVDGPHPHRWAWRVFQNGKDDHMRPHERRCARARPPTCPHLGSWSQWRPHNMLTRAFALAMRRRCPVLRHRLSPSPPLSPSPSPPSTLPPRRFPSPERCRSMAAAVRLSGTQHLPRGSGFVHNLGSVSSGAAVGVREGWDLRSGTLWSTLVLVCVPLLGCLTRRANGCEQCHSQVG